MTQFLIQVLMMLMIDPISHARKKKREYVRIGGEENGEADYGAMVSKMLHRMKRSLRGQGIWHERFENCGSVWDDITCTLQSLAVRFHMRPTP